MNTCHICYKGYECEVSSATMIYDLHDGRVRYEKKQLYKDKETVLCHV